MSTLARIRAQGFEIRLTDRHTIAIKPSNRLPAEIRDWISGNRQRVINELQAEAANNGNNKFEKLTNGVATNYLSSEELKAWNRFLTLSESHGVTMAEVVKMHRLGSQLQWVDVAALVGADLDRCMATMAQAIKRQRSNNL